MPNLANTFVDDITPAIYAYNQELSRISYNQFVFACKRCLSIYSKVIDDIEEEYNHLNNAVNTGQTIDDILKRLDQIATVLNQFNECQIVHTSTSFIPIVLKLERTMKSDVDTNAEKLKQNKKELELLKGIIANQEAGILIPKIQELNNRAKLLQDNIRNSWIQVVITNENVETLTLEQKSSIQGNSKQLTNPDNEDATPLSEFDAENLYLPQSGKIIIMIHQHQ